MQYTPELVTSLQPNEVFVFGSNLLGQHGGGAAKLAVKWGAVWGVGVGHHGQTYAIPTKSDFMRTLPIEEIAPFVKQFILYAQAHAVLTFLVTKIGTGLAGIPVEKMAPLFADAVSVPNIILPIEFSKKPI